MGWAAGLLVLTMMRLLVAATMPLSADEAYYWVWSRALAPGYLDHPPMVALWIRAGTGLVGETALGVRLLGPVSAAMGSVLLADAGARLFGRAAGLRAAVLLNATVMLGAGAVTMTPDTPVLFFWVLAVWALARVATGRAGWWWLVVGVAAGLGLDSKYTAALLGVGIAAWLLTPEVRVWLRTPWPWLGGVAAALTFAPVVTWNAAHGWASFAKQGGRAADWAPSQAVRFLAELVGGQAGLATPIVAGLFVWGVAVACRRWREPRWGLLAALALPGAAVFAQHAVGDRVQANWVAVLYPGAALAAGAVVPTRWVRGGAALGFAFTALLYMQAAAPVSLPRGLDPTLRLAGWDKLARESTTVAAREGLGFVAAEEYGVASLLTWWRGGTVAAGARWTTFDLPPAPNGAGLLVLSGRRREGPDPLLWDQAVELGGAARGRGDVVAETFRFYRVVRRPGAVAVALPAR